MPVPKSPVRGFFLALAGTALVSTNFVTAKYALRGFNPETFSSVWTTAGALYALIILLFSGQARQLALPRTAPVLTLLLGALTGAGMILTWAGLKELDPSFAAFLWRFMPVLILLLGVVFLRERLRAIEIILLALMILGGVYGTLGRWDVVGFGVMLTLGAAFAGAWQMLIAKILTGRAHPHTLVFFRLGPGAVFIVLWTLCLGRFDFNVPLRYWAVTLLGALLGPCLAHVFTFRSYRHWELSRSSIVLAVQPLFVLPLAYVFLGQFPVGKELLGGVLILLGSLWLGWIHLAPKRPVPGNVV
ncbi:MAG: DMT family transporter [Planctomycetota bacterium]|jgi:drug/metabolite transporter (DMT)-like permease